MLCFTSSKDVILASGSILFTSLFISSNDILLSLSNDIFDVEKLTITLFNLSSLLSPSSTSLAQFAQSKFNILYLYLFK